MTKLPEDLQTLAAITRFAGLIVPTCAAWFVIDSFFELKRNTLVYHWLTENVNLSFKALPFFVNALDHFIANTLDTSNLRSIVAGTIATYSTILVNYQKGYDNDRRD